MLQLSREKNQKTNQINVKTPGPYSPYVNVCVCVCGCVCVVPYLKKSC